MLIKLFVLNCLLIYVVCDDLTIPNVSIPKITIDEKSNDFNKKSKISGQKHILSAGGLANIDKKSGNAEKVSNYEKDKGFFFMKTYGWDREKKNDHINAEGKHLKVGKSGKIFKENSDFNKKLNENYGDNDRDYNKNYDRGSFNEYGGFEKRIGYSKPINEPLIHKNIKYLQPEVEYIKGPASYELIEPKTNYYPNKEYTRIHYPLSGSYLSSINNKNIYQTYKNSRRYPDKDTFKNNLWNQGYHATKYYSNKPTIDPIEENLVEYYEKSKYQPMIHMTHHQEYPSKIDYSLNEHNEHYSDDNYSNDEDEGKHYYDKKMTDFDIDKLRASYSKYNGDYAGSQLLPQKVQIETSIEPTKKYRLWEGSHYY